MAINSLDSGDSGSSSPVEVSPLSLSTQAALRVDQWFKGAQDSDPTETGAFLLRSGIGIVSSVFASDRKSVLVICSFDWDIIGIIDGGERKALLVAAFLEAVGADYDVEGSYDEAIVPSLNFREDKLVEVSVPVQLLNPSFSSASEAEGAGSTEAVDVDLLDKMLAQAISSGRSIPQQANSGVDKGNLVKQKIVGVVAGDGVDVEDEENAGDTQAVNISPLSGAIAAKVAADSRKKGVSAPAMAVGTTDLLRRALQFASEVPTGSLSLPSSPELVDNTPVHQLDLGPDDLSTGQIDESVMAAVRAVTLGSGDENDNG